jgi:hypothetical protein
MPISCPSSVAPRVYGHLQPHSAATCTMPTTATTLSLSVVVARIAATVTVLASLGSSHHLNVRDVHLATEDHVDLVAGGNVGAAVEGVRADVCAHRFSGTVPPTGEPKKSGPSNAEVTDRQPGQPTHRATSLVLGRTCPVVTLSILRSSGMVVGFPALLGPGKPCIYPAAMFNERPVTAWNPS